MQYYSPIRLVTHVEEPLHPFSFQTLSRARKKLLAEMALQGGELKLDDVVYTRNDVLSLFDSIKDENIWQYHCIIYTYPPLLLLLEQDVFAAEDFKSVEPLLKNEGFVSFVSPYFSHSFQEISGGLIKYKDYEGLALLLNYQAFMMPEHRYDACQRIRIYLDDLIQLLKNLNWEKFSRDESQLHFLFNGNWIGFLNRLPGEFDEVRDEIVSRMLSVIERLQRKATWYYLHQCCLQLQYIVCSATVKAEVDKFERIIGNNTDKEGRKSESSSPSAGRVFFGIIWVIIALFRFAGSCNSSSSSSHYNYDFPAVHKALEETSGNRIYTELGRRSNEALFKGLLGSLHVGADTFQVLKNKTGAQPLKGLTLPFPRSGKAGVSIHNKTGYDCVLFYFKKEDEQLKWETGRPVAYSAYIKNGHKYDIHINPDEGNFNFYFGRKWIRMDTPLIYPIKDIQGEDAWGHGMNVVVGQGSIPECFVPLQGFRQTLLAHNLVLHQPAFYGYDSSHFKLLHAPAGKAKKGDYKMKLDLVAQNGQVRVTSKGDLYLLQSTEN